MIEKEVIISSFGHFHMNFDKTEPAYLKVFNYIELTYKPAMIRLIEQIMYLYRLTIENDSCVLRHVNRGDRKFIIVSDSFHEYHLPKFFEYRRTIEEYKKIASDEITRICRSHCKYGDARCYRKLYSCECKYEYTCQCGNCEYCCIDYDNRCDKCINDHCKNGRFINGHGKQKICVSCYLKKHRPDCNCNYYYFRDNNMLSITHATRKNFVSIKFEVDGEQLFYFAFLVGKNYSIKHLNS